MWVMIRLSIVERNTLNRIVKAGSNASAFRGYQPSRRLAVGWLALAPCIGRRQRQIGEMDDRSEGERCPGFWIGQPEAERSTLRRLTVLGVKPSRVAPGPS
jgi:hypothetical protein